MVLEGEHCSQIINDEDIFACSFTYYLIYTLPYTHRPSFPPMKGTGKVIVNLLCQKAFCVPLTLLSSWKVVF
jgi:hypothetical protein